MKLILRYFKVVEIKGVILNRNLYKELKPIIKFRFALVILLSIIFGDAVDVV
jgi:hypothetical protein